MRKFTTNEAAAQLKISRVTLYNWIREGRITPPPRTAGKRTRRFWTDADLDRVRAARAAFKSRRGRPRKIVDVATVRRLRAAGQPWRVVVREVRCCIPVARRAAQIASKVRR